MAAKSACEEDPLPSSQVSSPRKTRHRPSSTDPSQTSPRPGPTGSSTRQRSPTSSSTADPCATSRKAGPTSSTGPGRHHRRSTDPTSAPETQRGRLASSSNEAPQNGH